LFTAVPSFCPKCPSFNPVSRGISYKTLLLVIYK
jgi:hypothetical protein